jgi:integrase/recombinase XerD
MLRHTFLKKVTDKHGVHFSQEISDNVSIKEIFRYAKPSEDVMQEAIENLF